MRSANKYRNLVTHARREKLTRSRHLLNWKRCSSHRDLQSLEKVKAFFYAHSVTDADRENILSLKKSYFQFRQNSAKKQKTMYDSFVKKKKWFSGLIVSPYSLFVFSTPLKNDRSRFYCINKKSTTSSSICWSFYIR
jgi:hypothetical protein